MHRERPRKIGVIGGMGPAATVLFMARVIERTQASDDIDHIPMMVDNNTQVPSRIAALLEGGGDDPTPILADMAKGLEAAGAHALAMPCNTAHNYAPSIRQAVAIPLLDMVELTVERIAAMPLAAHRVGILGSPALRRTGIYERAFSARGISVICPADDAAMLSAIREIKVSSTAPGARETLAEAVQELVTAGTDVLLVACSEFSIVTDVIPTEFTMVDSVNVLADAVVAFAFDMAQAGGTDARRTA